MIAGRVHRRSYPGCDSPVNGAQRAPYAALCLASGVASHRMQQAVQCPDPPELSAAIGQRLLKGRGCAAGLVIPVSTDLRASRSHAESKCLVAHKQTESNVSSKHLSASLMSSARHSVTDHQSWAWCWTGHKRAPSAACVKEDRAFAQLFRTGRQEVCRRGWRESRCRIT